MNLKQRRTRILEAARARREQSGRRGLRRRAPRWLHPEAIEREYLKFLVGIVDRIEQSTREILFTRLKSLKAQADTTIRGDDFVDDIEQLMAALAVASAAATNQVQAVAAGVALQISTFNQAQYERIIKATLGVSPLKNDPFLATRLKAFARQNASLIVGISDELRKEIEGIAMRGLTGGSTVRDMERDIRKRFKTTRARARLIARDQTGKLNAQLTEIRQTRIGINEYIWNSVNDERVRDSHLALDGKICTWDNPSVYRERDSKEWVSRSLIGGYEGHPGDDYQCRCFPEPILEEIIDDTRE